MARYFCHEYPESLRLETTVLDAVPGRVLLQRTPFYPGGGGQLPDRGTLHWQNGKVEVSGFAAHEGAIWHVLAAPVELSGMVEAVVDAPFRRLMSELHTDLHVVNALVYQGFDGALVTGVQMNEDGTARIDFDLPQADNDRLRALESAINDAIAQQLAVHDSYIPEVVAFAEPGLVRSRSVAPPPTEDGNIRVVEIAGLDRQACGGTHLVSTGASRPVRILKVDNKGRHNRRLRIGLTGVSC
jgi:misacylated tRNA(Ala) deacylase